MGTFTRMVRFTVAIGAVCGVLLFLLLVIVFRRFLKRCQSFVPKVGEMIAQKGDAFGIQFVEAARALAAVAHEASLLQDAQML